MRVDKRLLQVATAALYLGPLLAGMAGFGWAMLPPFVSIFVLWLVVTRPQQWPRSHAEWLTAPALISALSQVLTQTLLVAMCFGIGRGLGGATGMLPAIHPILPVMLSFAALAVTRFFWDPEVALAEGRTIDELMYPDAHPPLRRPAILTAEGALAELLALRDDAPLAEAQPLVAEVLDDADTHTRLSGLIDALSVLPATRHAALRVALIHWATEPAPFAAGTAPGALRAAFAAAGHDADLLRLLVPRALALASAVPGRSDQFPDPAVIDDIARRNMPADLSAALARLADRLRKGPPAPRKGGTGRLRRPLGQGLQNA